MARKIVVFPKTRTIFTQGDPHTEKRFGALLLLAHYGQDEEPETIICQNIAGDFGRLSGTRRSHVDSFMNRFRKQGYIHYNGGLQVQF